MRKVVPILVFTLFSLAAFSQSPSKVMSSLRGGDYPQAWEYIKKLRQKEKDPLLLSFASAQYFYQHENPNRNLDSAHYYAGKADKWLPLDLNNKSNRKLAEEGIRQYYLDQLRSNIYEEAFDRAVDSQTVESLQHFLSLYQESPRYDEVLAMRNELAYQEASSSLDYRSLKKFIETYEDAEQVEEAKAMYEYLLYRSVTADSSYESFAEYLEEYPEGAYTMEAQANYELKLFESKTKSGTVEAYDQFIDSYPQSPFRGRAEDRIYQLMTASQDVNQLEAFVLDFPNNRNNSEAWLLLYELSTISASDSSYKAFNEKYPDFPYPELLDKDLNLSLIHPTRYEKNSKYGYLDTVRGDTITRAWFYEAAPFSQGLAYVSESPCDNGCQYGYINKAGEMVIPARFDYASDFVSGFAIVGVGDCNNEDCQYGIIDKKGIFLIPPRYEEVYPFSHGLALVGQTGKGYSFLNKKGKIRIGPDIQDARPFHSGLAPIKVDSTWQFIDTTGKTAFDENFYKAAGFSDGLAAVSADGKNYYYIDSKNSIVIPGPFVQASDFDDGKAQVTVINEKGQRSTYFIDLEGNRLKTD
jgi:hypothetical protein